MQNPKEAALFAEDSMAETTERIVVNGKIAGIGK